MADISITRWMPSLRFTISRPEIQMRASSVFFSASRLSSPFKGVSSSPSGLWR